MSTSRVDTWTKDEDLLLSETVLRHIRQGSTQLKAFDEVGEKLNRSSAGCAFRWNGIVRHNYTEAILFAKKLRNDGKRHKKISKGKPEPKSKDAEPKAVEVKGVTEQLKAVIVEEIPVEKEKTEILNILCEVALDCKDKPKSIYSIQRVLRYVLTH